MTTSKKTTKATPAGYQEPDLDGYDVVDVDELDYPAGQKSEAREKKLAFRLRGRVYRFKPMSQWTFEAEEAFGRNDFGTWARATLVDPQDFAPLSKNLSSDWVKMVQHFIRESRASLGEGDDSSGS